MEHWRRKKTPGLIEGPLTPVLKSYATFLNYLGYARKTFLHKTWLIIQFSRWLKGKRVAIEALTLRHTDRFLRGYSCRAPGDAATLTEFVVFLSKHHTLSRNALQTHPRSPVDMLIDEYSTYLLQERGLAPTSTKAYANIVRRFLRCTCPAGRSDLAALTAQKVCNFIVREAEKHKLSRGTDILPVAVRSFLRFAQHCGEIKNQLAAAIPRVAAWSEASIPRALPLKHVRRVLAQSKQRRTPCGLRDYAILLLLARLGLRAREIMLLGLDDIDWNNSRINVFGKGDQERPMPLPQDVGLAIATYLREGRPKSPCRRVFLTASAPWRGMASSGTISAIVERALKRAGIHSATYGAHQFRHALAANMLHKGASLTEISHVLRHRDPNTTRIYAKIDLDALREVALRWPGRPL